MPVKIAIYVNVLEKEVKPTRFKRYLIASKIINISNDIYLTESLNGHTIKVIPDFGRESGFERITLILSFSSSLSNNFSICILTDLVTSCQPDSFITLPDRAYYFTRIATNVMFILYYNNKSYYFIYDTQIGINIPLGDGISVGKAGVIIINRKMSVNDIMSVPISDILPYAREVEKKDIIFSMNTHDSRL